MTAPSPRRFVIDMFSSSYPAWCMPETDVQRIRATLPDEWEVVRLTEEVDASGDGVPRMSPALRDAAERAEVYCGFGIGRDLFRVARSLRWVHSGTAGVGRSLFPELIESDVVLTNSAGVHAVPVAEHALAMMLYFARGLDRIEADRRERRWSKDVAGAGSPVRELTDSLLGIVGYGGIGRELARRARGLGMRVWAIKREPGAGREEPPVDRLLGPESLDELLRAVDYVVIAVPHTPETDRLIGGRELDLMKREAVLINVARGRIVEEDALIEALRARGIRGAGLDVFETEPLPESSPLWEIENVCLTPHVASVTPRFWERETELIVENARRYLAGRPMINVVDKKAGY